MMTRLLMIQLTVRDCSVALCCASNYIHSLHIWCSAIVPPAGRCASHKMSGSGTCKNDSEGSNGVLVLEEKGNR